MNGLKIENAQITVLPWKHVSFDRNWNKVVCVKSFNIIFSKKLFIFINFQYI